MGDEAGKSLLKLKRLASKIKHRELSHFFFTWKVGYVAGVYVVVNMP
jgi:hypothetical protein